MNSEVRSFDTNGPGDASPESREVPFQSTSLLNHRVLVLAPHQDDESLGCGGALALHRDHQDPVKVVFLTDGSKGESRGDRPKEEYVRIRCEESRQACGVLGISDIEFWEIPDRELADDAVSVSRLVQLLELYRPTLVYAPSPLEFHPDHRAAAAILWQAFRQTTVEATAAFYEVNRPLRVNTLVDITPVVETKKQACDVYRSQIASHPYTDIAIGLNRYRSLTISDSAQFAEGFFLLQRSEIVLQPLEMFALQQLRPVTERGKGEQPLVSIIVRTQDRLPLLRQALASISAQTYPHLEVVIVNDGGADISSVVKEFSDFLSIRCQTHERAVGRAAAANSGLQLARGKYLNFLDDDDVFYPRHVEKMVTYLETTAEQFAYSDCEVGQYRWRESDFQLVRAKELFKGFEFDLDRLYWGSYIPIMTAMFTRRLLDRVGLMDESLDVFEDWDLWLRMAQETIPHRLPGITAEYRVLAEHNFDYRHWLQAVYRKYQDHWSVQNLAESICPRIENLHSELACLKHELARHRQALDSEQAKHHQWQEAQREWQETQREWQEAQSRWRQEQNQWQEEQSGWRAKQGQWQEEQSQWQAKEAQWQEARRALEEALDAEREMIRRINSTYLRRLSYLVSRFVPRKLIVGCHNLVGGIERVFKRTDSKTQGTKI